MRVTKTAFPNPGNNKALVFLRGLCFVWSHQESNKTLSYCYLLDFCCRMLITISKFILLAKLSLVLPDVPTGPNDWHCLCPILQRMNLARMAHMPAY